MRTVICGEEFQLMADRAIYRPSEKSLIISDTHLGKTGHFRKSGIAVPQAVYKEDLQRLFHLIQFCRAEKLIVVGDLFHSRENRELDLFLRWRRDLQTEIHLVRGNHDILSDAWYRSANIIVHAERLIAGTFSFVHDCAHLKSDEAGYAFCGHLHPGVVVSGVAKQHLRLPCFHFTDRYVVLPAFSRFTGLAIIDAREDDSVVAIANRELILLHDGQRLGRNEAVK